MKKVFMIISVLFFITACNQQVQEADVTSGEYYYTCSMHPQIHENHPGICPICHMELIKVKKTQSAPDEVTLNEEQIRLGNIVSDTISFSELGGRNVLTATVVANESKVEGISARIEGRIDKLFYKTIGDYVAKGKPVFSIYSETLNHAKQELIALVQKKKVLDNRVINFDNLIEAARQKLLLLGVSNSQIETMIQSGHSSELTTFYSPASGTLTELPVIEGDYVSEGTMVMKLADLSGLWVEAQVYASQLPLFTEGKSVMIEFPDLSGKRITGKISFINPELIPGSRLATVRISVPNQGGELKPGMAAYVVLSPNVENTLTLPTDAIIRDGKNNIVWVQTGKETFKWRKVETGNESNHRVGIVSGLEEGDRVVMSGAYLVNSEYLLKKGGH